MNAKARTACSTKDLAAPAVVRVGLVTLNSRTSTMWVLCPVHGPVAPAISEVRKEQRGTTFKHAVSINKAEKYAAECMGQVGRILNETLVLEEYMAASCCGLWAPIKTITLRDAGPAGGVCGSACLNGKRSCDCRCKGRCHGNGTCVCAAEAA